jgi:hypothetical protein
MTPPATHRPGTFGGSEPIEVVGEKSSQEPASSAETASLAAYIADMSAELATLAGRSQMPMLAYFLNLARVEAEIRSRELGGYEIKRRA